MGHLEKLEREITFLYTISLATVIFASNFGAFFILSKEKTKRWKQAEYIDEEAIIIDKGKGEKRPENAIRCTRARASMWVILFIKMYTRPKM